MPALSPVEIESAFGAAIPRIPVTAGYRLRLAGVLAGLVLLQALYLLLIALVVWLGYLWIIHFTGLLALRSWIGIFLYASPPVAAAILTIFLLKPLLARPAKPAPPVEIQREREPELFAFVEKLCRTVGAPVPQKIRANLQANAFAAIAGWRGFLTGGVELTIGLPLVRGLSLAGFAGVLAHEFGHFAQSAGLRSYYLIQSIQMWFARVVYERDSWDAWLEGYTSGENEDVRLMLVRLFARGGVWLSRKYLELLMRAGQWISAAFSRQMEFDADRYEAAVVGPAVFRETSLRLPELSVATEFAWQTTQEHFELGRLPDDVSSLSAAHVRLLPEDNRRQLRESELARTTERFATHPATAERIASVERWNPPGVFTLAGDATRLFRDLDALSRAATRHHYQLVLGERFREEDVFAAATVEAALDRQATEARLLEEWLGRDSIYWLELPDVPPEGGGPPAAVAYDRENYSTRLGEWFEASGRQLLAEAGLSLEETQPLAQAEQALAETQAALRGTAQTLVRALAEATRRSPEALTAWRACVALQATRAAFCEATILLSAARFFGQAAAGDAARVATQVEAFQERGLAKAGLIMEQLKDTPSLIVLDERRPATLGLQLDPGEGDADTRLDRFGDRWAALARRSLGALCRIAHELT